MDLCTISGTIYDVQGAPVAGVNVYVEKVIQSGSLIQSRTELVAVSDEAGLISFDVPRNSTAWISGSFYAGSTYFSVNGGVSLAIPDASSATLESLGAAAVVPTQGLTVKSNGSALGHLIGTLDFSTAFALTESPTGEANVDLAASLIVTQEQVQDALSTFFPDSGAYDWTYDDNNNKVGLVIANATPSVSGLMSAADKTTFDAMQAALDLKAPLASPALTGIPTAPTAGNATSSTQLATTEFVHGVVSDVIGAAPAALDTLVEIANQLASDESAVSALTTTVAGKLAKASNLSDLTNASTARTNLGLAPVASSGSASDLSSGTLNASRLPANLGATAAVSLALSGTGGAGFVEFIAQSSAPAAPAGGFRLYGDSAGKLSWIRQSDGFTRSFDATLTANRVYTLPDADTKFPIASQVLTFAGPTAARTITLPDASITVARIDAGQTFVGADIFQTSVTVGNASSSDGAIFNVNKASGAGIFSVDTSANTVSLAAAGKLMWSTRSSLASAADGQLRASNNLQTGLQAWSLGATIPSTIGTAPSHGQTFTVLQAEELLTIAAAATTTTTMQIPAGAVILAVHVRTTVVIPTAATYTVKVGAVTFSTAPVSTAANSTDPGTAAGASYLAAATGITITPNLTPGAATGVVRITAVYYVATPSTS